MRSEKRKTVKRRIFLSNALMILVTLLLFLFINLAVLGVSIEAVEKEVKSAVEENFEHGDMEELFKEMESMRAAFLFGFLADGILCVGTLLGISQIFTKNLTRHIMEPLEELRKGAKRVQNNDLRQEIAYTGDAEFETVCDTFNEMQRHILEEQEKNRRYEKARTDMIAGISHDLRTPLTAIRGTIKGLMDGIADAPGQRERFLEAAYRRAGEMNVLLDQLFYLSKLETGNLPVHLRRVEMGEFLKNYVEARKKLPENGEMTFFWNAKQRERYAWIDPEQMQRILDNLLENSRKYAGADKLEIAISLEKRRDGVRISFRDNGVGVPGEKLSHIFEEFYRGDESRNLRPVYRFDPRPGLRKNGGKAGGHILSGETGGRMDCGDGLGCDGFIFPV